MSKGAPPLALQPAQRVLAAFHHEFVHTDAAQTVTVPVKAGTFIPAKGVAVAVPTAFTTSGANASLLVGVTGDTDALMNATSTALQTRSDASGTEPKVAANAEDNLNGYLFTADGELLLTFAPAAAGATAGRAIVQVMFGVAATDGIAF